MPLGALTVALLPLLPTTLVIRAYTGQTTAGYGTYLFSNTTEKIRGRLFFKPTFERGPLGETQIGDHVCWLASTVTRTLRDRFSVAGATGTTYKIMRIERPPDLVGVNHTKLVLRLVSGGE